MFGHSNPFTQKSEPRVKPRISIRQNLSQVMRNRCSDHPSSFLVTDTLNCWSEMRAILLGVIFFCLLGTAASVNAQVFNLSNYKIESEAELSNKLGEFSGLAWDSSNKQLLVATNKKVLFSKKAYVVALSDDGVAQNRMTRLHNIKKKAKDIEGIASIGGDGFVFIEETRELLTFAMRSGEVLLPTETIDIAYSIKNVAGILRVNF